MNAPRPPVLRDLAELGPALKKAAQAEPASALPSVSEAQIDKAPVAVARAAAEEVNPVTAGPGDTFTPAAVGEKNATPSAVVSNEIPVPSLLNQIEKLLAEVEAKAQRIRELEADVRGPGDEGLTPWEQRLRDEEKTLANDRLAFERELDELDTVRRREIDVAEREREADQLQLNVANLTSEKGKLIERLAKTTKTLRAARSELRTAHAAYAESERQLGLRDRALKRAQKSRDLAKDDLLRVTAERDAALELLDEFPDLHIRRKPILDWLVSESDGIGIDLAEGASLGWTGEGPYESAVFDELISDRGVDQDPLPDKSVSHVVVGREGWSEEALIQQIEVRQGKPLRVYSQEMVVAAIITGRDPFESNDEELLLAFAKGHPALEFLLGLPEPWPKVCNVESSSVDFVGADDYGVTETPLHLLGYHVGATSRITESRRRELLTECFKTNSLKFTDSSSEDYRHKWGRGGSAQRLYRMAVHIKWLAEGQGKDSRKQQARIDWVDDLKWLRKTFHQPMTRRFQWP